MSPAAAAENARRVASEARERSQLPRAGQGCWAACAWKASARGLGSRARERSAGTRRARPSGGRVSLFPDRSRPVTCSAGCAARYASSGSTCASVSCCEANETCRPWDEEEEEEEEENETDARDDEEDENENDA